MIKHVEAAGKQPLLINLYETAIPVVFTKEKSTVMVCRGADVWRAVPRLRVSKADTRMYFTLVATICSNPEIQRILPQVLFVGASTIKADAYAALKANLPDNVYIRTMPKG